MMRRGRLAHDGKDILVQYRDPLETRDEWKRARDSQPGLHGVIEQAMTFITWGDDGFPSAISLDGYPDTRVIADPEVAFGQPVLADTRVRVADVVSLWKARETIATIAQEFRVPEGDIESVLRSAA